MYNSLKPFKTTDGLIALLKSRNMVIADENNAKLTLEKINYYRLSEYSYKFRISKSDVFLSGTTFEDITRLYYFDEKLKEYLYIALAKIEIYFRAKLSTYLADVSGISNAQDDVNLFQNQMSNNYSYVKWHNDIYRRFIRALDSGNPIAIHHKNSYGGKLPIWVLVEFFDFSDLSRMFALMQPRDQHIVASSLGLTISRGYKNIGGKKIRRPKLPSSLIDWLKQLSIVRNICAHHARLWDSTHIRPVGIKDGRCKGYFDDIPEESDSITGVYGTLTIVLFLLEEIEPPAEFKKWVSRFKTLIIDTFIQFPAGISEKDMGFPDRDEWCGIYPWNSVP